MNLGRVYANAEALSVQESLVDSSPITVACVWVRGNVPYDAEYVYRLQAMVYRHLDRRHRFVCLTDRPNLLPGIATVRVPAPDGFPGWWSKLELFNPERGLAGRCLYLDLDSLVVGDLAPVADFDASFALVPHAGTFEGRAGLRVVKRYNTSVMTWDVSDRLHEIWNKWSPGIARQLWGDQDWISVLLPDEFTMPAEWFPRVSDLGLAEPRPPVVVVLCKKPKNREAARDRPWIDRVWRAA